MVALVSSGWVASPFNQRVTVSRMEPCLWLGRPWIAGNSNKGPKLAALTQMSAWLTYGPCIIC